MSNPKQPVPAKIALTAFGPSLPVVTLPPKVPVQRYRPTQSNIPNQRTLRDRLKTLTARYAEEHDLQPPLSLKELREHAAILRAEAGIDPNFDNYMAILVNNAVWRETLAKIPYERRLLLMPKCLRVEEHCPAPFDQFGLLCKECGLCSIQDLGSEAERLGYAVLVAEGSAVVTKMVESGRIEAIVGVSCLNVLEKCFPHMEAAAVPGIAIPLLQDDCINTTVDLDWVWDAIHLTSDDKSYRLDLDTVRDEVKSWFAPDALDQLMGPAQGETEAIAREWLARDGKRWRPFLTACTSVALGGQQQQDIRYEDDLKKLAIAVECFHKASLIHDDIEDGDAQRYGQDTLHVEVGTGVALNVGDFLLGEGYRLIAETQVPADARIRMLQEAARGHVTLSRGQGAELCWARAPRPLASLEVLQIFREKTAPAFEVALQLGALHAGFDPDVQAVLREYSEAIGLAYQIHDDLEDHTGESDSNDLEDLRPSLLLAIAHKRAESEADQELIASLWRREQTYQAVAAEATRIFAAGQVVEKARELQNAYEEQAVRALRFLKNPTLKGLLRRVVGKIFPPVLFEGVCGEFEARNAAGRAARTASAG